MAAKSLLFAGETSDRFDCDVRGVARTPVATIELHDYHFHGSQEALAAFPRSFLDLALSRRPGPPRGQFPDAPGCGTQAMGDVIFVPAGMRLHSEWGAGRQRSICLEFHGPSDRGACWSAGELASALDVQSPFVRDALLRLARELECPGFESALMIDALSTQIGIEIGRYFRAGRPSGLPCTRALGAAALRRLDERIDSPGPLPGVAELAAECGTSPRHFFRLFRAATGSTLSDYAARRRLDRARARLAGRVPIKQIAWECGFETPAAFSAAFRRATGYRPREYRQLLSA